MTDAPTLPPSSPAEPERAGTVHSPRVATRQGPSPIVTLLMRPVRAFLGLGRKVLSLIATVIFLFVLYAILLQAIQPASEGREMKLSDVFDAASHHRIARATIYDEDARVVLATDRGDVAWASLSKSGTDTSPLVDALRSGGASFEVDQQSGKAVSRFVVTYLLPLVILAALFGLVFVITTGKGGASEFAAFSKIGRGRERTSKAFQVTFADVAAAGEAVQELQEIVDYLRDPARYVDMGARAPKGVLLCGPPGTGKTLLARAVAGEADVPFFSLSGSEFVESLVGVGAARVRDLFRAVREAAPSILFIDELDAAGRQRGAGMGQGNDEREQTLNQLLVEMDGFSAGTGITVLGATNRPDILDPALLRPGRFDRQVVVDAPDVEGRREILQLHSIGRPLGPDVDLARIARQTPGFTGAELANLINEAALVAVRNSRRTIEIHDLEEAVDRVIAGPQRRSHVLTEEERRLVAFHEAGHAVVAAGVDMPTGVQKLSIVARGRTLGHTTTYQIEDRLVVSQSDLRRKLIALMGGLAAEQLVFGEISTGAEGDVQEATQLARSMVANYAMGETLGRVAIAQKQGEVFLGRDIAKMHEVSEATLQAVDSEIHSMLDRAEEDASAIIAAHGDLLNDIAGRLLDRETLSGPELEHLLAQVRPHHEPSAARRTADRSAALMAVPPPPPPPLA